MENYDNPPFQNAAFDEQIRALLAADPKVDVAPEGHALRNISVVGAIIRDTPNGFCTLADDLFKDDRTTIAQTARLFSAAGIPVHPEIKFAVYCLLPPVRSSFLHASNPIKAKELPHADLVIISYVPNKAHAYRPGDRPHDTSGYSKLSDIYADFNDARHRSICHLDTRFDAWPQSAFNIRARFIIIRGAFESEINTEHFRADPRARVLIPTRHFIPFGPNYYSYTTTDSYLGLVAHKPRLHEIQDKIRKNSLIGYEIERALSQ